MGSYDVFYDHDVMFQCKVTTVTKSFLHHYLVIREDVLNTCRESSTATASAILRSSDPEHCRIDACSTEQRDAISENNNALFHCS